MRRLLALSLLALLLVGCSRTHYTPPRPVRMAVMPFTAPENVTGQPFDIHGWWFGSRDVRQSRNVGGWTAESLSRQLETLDTVEVIPPYDLRRYLMEQRRILMQAHDDLTEEQIDALLIEVPLVDYGRDLEVDKIVTGQIFTSRLSHNRTIDTWASTVEFQIQVWDVSDMAAAEMIGAPQTPEYEARVAEREWFDSWLETTDEAGRELVGRMERDYFRDPLHFAGL